MNPELAAFQSALQKLRTTELRQNTAALRIAHGLAFPERHTRPDNPPHILHLLQQLEQAGAITLPKSQHLWETGTAHPLPLWIQWATTTTRTPPFQHRTYPWVPQLRFIASLIILRNPNAALAIQKFLLHNGHQQPLVPIKERSWELFQDEKLLDSLLNGSLFAPGRLTLDTLRCFIVPNSLACYPGPANTTGPWLIIENAATFYSFAQWNKTARAHRGVIFGSGFAIHETHEYIHDLLNEEHAEYFGDLDEAGCRIPWDFHRKHHERYNTTITPAPYYTWLLDACHIQPSTPPDPLPVWLQWFPSDLQPRVWSATQAPKPPPQEAIGSQFLHNRTAPTA